jgi:hypothetical protein
MKYTILLIAALAAFSCSDDETTYSVSPELSSYVNAFYSEASLRSKSLPKDNLIVQIGQAHAITDISRDGDQMILTFDKEFFENYSSEQIEALLFHELGKLVLKREVIETAKFNDPNPVSLMNPYYKFSGYSGVDRQVMLDELFK